MVYQKLMKRKEMNGDDMSITKYSPFVSVIIPTYNRAQLLVKALQSVFNQTYQRFEILVVDDNSSDNTSEIINNFNDNRIKYFRLSENQGAPAARNIGLKNATGELIAFLDSDDQWLETKLEKQIEMFNKDTNIGLVYTGIKTINNNFTKITLPQKKGDLSKSILIKNYVGTTSSVMIKKDLIDEVGGFDLTFTSCQDWDLFIRLSQKCKFDFVKEPLVLYFEHSGARISTNSKSVVYGHLNIHKKYINLIKKLSISEIQKHYLNIGKIFMKVGILLVNRYILSKSKLLVYKFTKII